MAENTQLVIRQSDIEVIGQSLPTAYDESVKSHNRCIAAGQQYLAILAKEGMTDELDQKIAAYIKASSATVKKINDLRSPATKLFDQFKKVFTTMEGDIDPGKSGSIPYQLQQARNQYAAKKREEEERRRAEELRRQQYEQAKAKYRGDVEEEYLRLFDNHNTTVINELTSNFMRVSLENYEKALAYFKGFKSVLAEDWDKDIRSTVLSPINIPHEELDAIRAEVRTHLMDSRFRDQFTYTVGDTVDDILSKLPSKKKELEKIAAEAASAAEAEKKAEALRQKEMEEARRKEAERRAAQESEQRARESEKAIAEAGSLFDNAAAVGAPVYVPKTSVKKKINLLDKEGIGPIIGLWLADVGPSLSIEEICKEFKKQITYAEKKANSANPSYIESEFVEYVDDVKAK